MKLTILERIIVSRFLPNKGNYELIKAVEKTKPMLGFSEEEMRKYDITVDNSGGFSPAKFADDVKLNLANFKDEPIVLSDSHLLVIRELLRLNGLNENVKPKQQLINFNREATEGYEADIKFPAVVAAYIAKTLENLSNKNQLEPGMISVYEKFVCPKVSVK